MSVNNAKYDLFIEWLEGLGDIESAALAVNIDSRAIEKWIDRDPEFGDRCEKAMISYRKALPIVLKNQAKRALISALYGQNKQKTITKSVTYDQFGNILETEIKEVIVDPGPQRWAIERVLGSPITENEAIAKLADSGLLPMEVAYTVMSILEGNRDLAKQLLAEGIDTQRQKKLPGLSEKTAIDISQSFVD